MAQFKRLIRVDTLIILQCSFEGQQLDMQLVGLVQQSIAAVFQFLNLVHVSDLCSIRLGVG
ncbi:hypothetical protein [Pseudomonas syringae pv. coryli]|uniref:hypothetical protein n=1 Tax=Pseudomonas syringae pv. coryli TaxID=317659 RepID=UPI001F3B4198|nr:hypothetical protein [Pseudomonas syringae pv. coryli]